MGDESVKTFAAGLALATAALTVTPTAHADMLMGNYRVDTDRQTGHMLEGSDQPVEVTEVWTFLRSAGSDWVLSAIQQT